MAATGVEEPDSSDPRGGEEAGLQESEQPLRREVEALRVEVESLRERVETVERRGSWRRGVSEDGVDVEGVDVGDEGEQHRPVVRVPQRVFPELITEHPEPGEDQVYGAAAELIVEWREAWAERRSAHYTLDGLRAERTGHSIKRSPGRSHCAGVRV